jgi:hypothetical protein
MTRLVSCFAFNFNVRPYLMAYHYQYVAGQAFLEVIDFQTGETKKVDVDPLKGPILVAEKLYKRARKQRRTAGAVDPLLEVRPRRHCSPRHPSHYEPWFLESNGIL